MTDRTRNFGFLIKDIGRLYAKLFERQPRTFDCSLAEGKVLAYLQRNPGISQIGLADLTGVEPMSLVRILDRMEADGLIERRPHPTDRRARQLFLRDKAQATLDELWKLSDAMRAQALAGIKADERQVLINLLERIHENLIDAFDAREQAETSTEPPGKAARPRGNPRASPGARRSAAARATKPS
jgi:MarR family transcriptional regulator for hemolysin